MEEFTLHGIRDRLAASERSSPAEPTPPPGDDPAMTWADWHAIDVGTLMEELAYVTRQRDQALAKLAEAHAAGRQDALRDAAAVCDEFAASMRNFGEHTQAFAAEELSCRVRSAKPAAAAPTGAEK